MEMIIIGLGKMGKELAAQAARKGVRVIGVTRGPFPEDLKASGVVEAHDLEELLRMTESPRKIFLYVPAGPVVEEYVEKFQSYLQKGDIVVDGGNSYWGDSVRRYDLLASTGIRFIDLGTSGGISGARSGACFMAGGDRDAFEEIAPILERLSAPGAYAYVGPSGSGHMVKLIHNGIEFGMLQAIGEGMALLEKFRESWPLDMEGVFKTYRNGSVIRSWLIDLMHEQYSEHQGLNVPSYVEDTGEVNWLISDALHLEVPIPVISQSVMELFRSRDERRADHRSVALMRHGFGGHPFGALDLLKAERLSGRIRSQFQENLREH